MGKNSTIEWTDHTFNPWWGCTKISPACDNCYAERWSKRVGLNFWGCSGTRRSFGDRHWREPLKWDREARREGQRKRVFCASMGDVFEGRPDLDRWRARLWSLIEDTPWLDWLLLTKRPENIGHMVPWRSSYPSNVWLGTTVENQDFADKRIPCLIRYPSMVRFVSCEPLLGPVDLIPWLAGLPRNGSSGLDISAFERNAKRDGIHWVIAGGESGACARPTYPSWIRSLRDQCQVASVPFHFKQWGCWRPLDRPPNVRSAIAGTGAVNLVRTGKQAAGRELDGRIWDELPTRSYQNSSEGVHS
jgi:protein gp37